MYAFLLGSDLNTLARRLSKEVIAELLLAKYSAEFSRWVVETNLSILSHLIVNKQRMVVAQGGTRSKTTRSKLWWVMPAIGPGKAVIRTISWQKDQPHNKTWRNVNLDSQSSCLVQFLFRIGVNIFKYEQLPTTPFVSRHAIRGERMRQTIKQQSPRHPTDPLQAS